MPAIFVSHASQDNTIAAEVRERLIGAGHHNLFLDFHPEQGIPAGRDWEKELYAKLRAADAIVVLCSEHSMSSKWVFAEITHAKALGKKLFPIKVGPCQVDTILMSPQIVDLVADKEGGYDRLWRGLLEAGLDPATEYDWDPKRPPYPGLLAFQEADAAIFFGREKEVQSGLDRLRRLQRFGGPSWLMVLGPSGSGKSSLVRAGLVPQLRRNAHEWLLVGPFRPRPEPAANPCQKLAEAFESAFKRYGTPRDCRTDLVNPTDDVLPDLAQLLRESTGHSDATVVIVVDQVEELLGDDADTRETRDCLRLLRIGLERRDPGIMVIGTLRTDFLGDFLKNPGTRGFECEDHHVSPPSTDQWVRIIEGPAHRSALRLEPGLTAALVKDTETEDALPLLAFTLRELWEQYGADGELTIDEYREELGGLGGAVGRAAEAVFSGAGLGEAEEATLRRALLSMVRVNEQGRYVRQGVPWNTIDPAVHDLLHHFVSKRLLVSSREGEERSLEVAHEALFRSWDRLRKWLDEDREFLLWRQELQRARSEWIRKGQHPDALLRGVSLVEAQSWSERRAGDFSGGEQDYVNQSTRFRQLEQKKVERRRRHVLIGLAAGLLVASGLAATAGFQWRQAERQRQTALARQLAAQALSNATDRLDLALLLGVEASSIDDGWPTRSSLIAALQRHAILPVYLHGTSGSVQSVAFSPDGGLIAAPTGRRFTLWDVTTHQTSGEPLGSTDADITESAWEVAFSPDGRHIASSTAVGTVTLWDVATRRPIGPFETGNGARQLWSMAYSPDGTRLATGGCDAFLPPCDGEIRLYDVATRRLARPPITVHTDVRSVAYSPLGDMLAWGGGDGTVVLLDTVSNNPIDTFSGRQDGEISSLVFSPNARYLALTGDDNTISVWDVAARRPAGPPLRGHTAEVSALVFSRNDDLLFSGGDDGQVMLWSIKAPRPLTLASAPDDIASLALRPDGATLAVGDSSGILTLWDLGVMEPRRGLVSELGAHNGEVSSIAISPDGSTVASAGSDPALAMWSLKGDNAREFPVDQTAAGDAVAYSLDGRLLAWAGCGPGRTPLQCDQPEIRLMDTASGRLLGEPLRAHTDRIEGLAFNQDGTILASGSHDETIILWDTVAQRQMSEPLRAHTGFVQALAFSPDGTILASGSYDTTVILWDVATKRPIGVPLADHKAAVIDLAFDPSGTRLASASGDRTILLWDYREQRRIGPPLQGHNESVFSVAFSPDGELLASADFSGIIVIWNAKSLERLDEPFRWHTAAVTALAFTRDGRTLISAGQDGRIASWGLDIESWRGLACRSANRNLTWSEWVQYIGEVAYRKTCPALPIHPSLLEQARNLAAAGDLERAEALFVRATELDGTLRLQPREEVARTAAQAQVENGEALAKQGRIVDALAAFRRAQALYEALSIEANSWNSLCWHGALAGRPELVIDACDRAVGSAAEDLKPFFQDSRGVARATLGRRAEAIEDFKSFIAWTGKSPAYETYRLRREAWLRDLEAGGNPFDAATLDALKREE